MTPHIIIIHMAWLIFRPLGSAVLSLISLNEVLSITLLNIFWLGGNLFGKFLQLLKNTEEVHISETGVD